MLQGPTLHRHHEWQNKLDHPCACLEPAVDTDLCEPDLGWLTYGEFHSAGCFQWAKSNTVAVRHHSWQGIGGPLFGGSVLWSFPTRLNGTIVGFPMNLAIIPLNLTPRAHPLGSLYKKRCSNQNHRLKIYCTKLKLLHIRLWQSKELQWQTVHSGFGDQSRGGSCT